jgi:hypothetical protein
MKPLTPKQARFAELVAGGLSKNEGYLECLRRWRYERRLYPAGSAPDRLFLTAMWVLEDFCPNTSKASQARKCL